MEKFKAEDIKSKLDEYSDGSLLILLTGERGIFEICKVTENDPDFTIESNDHFKYSKSGMAMTNNPTFIKVQYKRIRVEMYPCKTFDDRSFNKILSPKGGLESSYNCILIKY